MNTIIENAEPDRTRAQSRNPRRYRDPTPSARLIQLTGVGVRWITLTGWPLLGAALRHFRRSSMLRGLPGFSWLSRLGGGLLQIRHIDFPEADQVRLQDIASSGSGVFLAPNHPEFFTDWMIDKYLSATAFPMVASWADWMIVNGHPLAQRFWLKNNLIANVPGGGGKRYSLRWADAGHAVLLHPEGRVTWNTKRIAPLFAGVIDMAQQLAQQRAANGNPSPVHVVPVVSRHTFTRNVHRELHREIETIERALGLPSGEDMAMGPRFGALNDGILAQRLRAFDAGNIRGGFFERQDALLCRLETQVTEAVGRVEPMELELRITAYRKANRRQHRKSAPEVFHANERRLDEMHRLAGMTVTEYGARTLSQEDIAACLKRLRRDLVTSNWRHRLHNFFPLPVAERDAHIRVATPLRIDASNATSANGLVQLRTAMQHALDQLNAELSDLCAANAVINPLIMPPPKCHGGRTGY